MSKEDEEENVVKLRVKMSPISGSGIARVNRRVLKMGDFQEGKPLSVEKDDRKRVMRLVADEIMDKGKISIRKKDMEKLKVREGDEVSLVPVKGIGDMLNKRLKLFKGRDDN